MAGARTGLQVKGLEETLRELRKVEPEYVKDFRKRARLNAADAVKSAKEEFKHTQNDWADPQAPLPGMTKGTLDPRRGASFIWNKSKVQRGIKFKLGGPKKAARKHRTYSMFSIIQNDGPGVMYDMAGKKKSNPAKNFEDTLENYDAQHRTPQPGYPQSGPSRYMWPGVWFFMPQLEDRMLKLVRELERKTNRRLIRSSR